MKVLVIVARSGYAPLVNTDYPCHFRSGVTNDPGRSFTDWKHQNEGWHA